MEVKSKFAPQNGVATTILIGRDFDTGQVHANELKSTVPGQMYFDENGEILTDIGQPVAEIEQQAETKPDIIDFNKKKVGN
ncbi:phage protein [Streptococcus pneumoniae]|nr:phage protein [Streptococcus pneumoniae]